MALAAYCAAVIPCLNEAATIGPIVREVLTHVPVVWVVDDGSDDDTGHLAQSAGARVIRHPRPQGKGAALREGVRIAGAEGFHWVLILDGDGQHSTDDIPTLLATAETTGAPMVVGNRMGQADRLPWLRRQVNRLMSWDLCQWTGTEVPDTQCGFRLVEIAAWNRARPSGEAFLIESGMLVAFAAAGLRVINAPIQVLPRTRGRSHIRSVRDTVAWFRWRRSARRNFRRPDSSSPAPPLVHDVLGG